MRLLLVDDDPRFLAALRALLERVPNVEVVGDAANGAEALRAVDQHKPDVVIMDLDMPIMDGLEATTRLRDSHPEIPIVILSGSDVVAHSAASHRAGAVAYLRKSNTVTDLPPVLESLAERLPP